MTQSLTLLPTIGRKTSGKWTQIIGDFTGPRKLSPDEIKYVLDSVPRVKSPDQRASDVATAGVKRILRLMLERIELVSSSEALDELKDNVVQRFTISQATPGEAVGVTPAEALAAISTQMTLKSFHTSGGSTSVGAGIEALQEILYTRLNRRMVTSTIFFNEKNLSMEQTLSKRVDLVNVTVSRIVKRSDIMDIRELDTKYWWYPGAGKPSSITKEIPIQGSVMRLTLNIDEMFRMKITNTELANILEGGSNEKNIVCVYGPLSSGIMDVYPYSDKIESVLGDKPAVVPELAQQVFLKVIFQPSLSKLSIKGIPGITNMTPHQAPVWQIVSNESGPIAPRDLPSGVIDSKSEGVYWYLTLNDHRTKTIGITRETLRQLLKLLSIEYTSDNEFGIFVRMPAGDMRRPSIRLKEFIDRDNQEIKDYRLKNKLERPASPLELAVNVGYVITGGSNLEKLLSSPDVDATLTITNNVHEIARTLGIEAAFTFLGKELNEIVRNAGSYVNPRHILIVMSVICSRGYPYGVTYNGAAQLGIGTFALASLERAPMFLTKGAQFGQTEAINVSSAVGLGQAIPIGTGSVSLRIDQKLYDDYEQQMAQRQNGSQLPVDVNVLQRTYGNQIVTQEPSDRMLDTFSDISEDKWIITGDDTYHQETQMELNGGAMTGDSKEAVPSDFKAPPSIAIDQKSSVVATEVTIAPPVAGASAATNNALSAATIYMPSSGGISLQRAAVPSINARTAIPIVIKAPLKPPVSDIVQEDSFSELAGM